MSKKTSVFWMIENNVKDLNVRNAIKGFIGELLKFKHRSRYLEEYLEFKGLTSNFEWWMKKK
jgi:hypothetical protein